MTTLRKRRLNQPNEPDDEPAPLNLARVATIDYSSEDPAHAVENLVDDRPGPGGSYWAAAQADTIEQLVLVFDQPQSVTRVVYEVEETERERTQEVHVETSTDADRTYRRVLVQEYTFCPYGWTFQREDQRFDLHGLTHLRLTVVPNKGGSGVATLTSLRVYA